MSSTDGNGKALSSSVLAVEDERYSATSDFTASNSNRAKALRYSFIRSYSEVGTVSCGASSSMGMVNTLPLSRSIGAICNTDA